jgi:hypothetical protein
VSLWVANTPKLLAGNLADGGPAATVRSIQEVVGAR